MPQCGALLTDDTSRHLRSQYVNNTGHSVAIYLYKLAVVSIDQVFHCNRTARIRHQCRKTIVLSCYKHLIYHGVEKMNNI